MGAPNDENPGTWWEVHGALDSDPLGGDRVNIRVFRAGRQVRCGATALPIEVAR